MPRLTDQRQKKIENVLSKAHSKKSCLCNNKQHNACDVCQWPSSTTDTFIDPLVDLRFLLRFMILQSVILCVAVIESEVLQYLPHILEQDYRHFKI